MRGYTPSASMIEVRWGHGMHRYRFAGERGDFLLIFSLLIAAIPPGAAIAAEPLQAQDLRWDRLPRGEDLANAFPRLAVQAGVEGRGIMLCRIAADRTVDACNVVASEPSNYPFGEAAIKLARKFKLSAHQSVAEAVEGASVMIKVKFNLPPELRR